MVVCLVNKFVTHSSSRIAKSPTSNYYHLCLVVSVVSVLSLLGQVLLPVLGNVSPGVGALGKAFLGQAHVGLGTQEEPGGSHSNDDQVNEGSALHLRSSGLLQHCIPKT